MNRSFTTLVILFLCLLGTHRAHAQAGNALDFDGNNDRVEIAGPLPFVQNKPYTIEGWAKVLAAKSNNQVLVSLYPTATSTLIGDLVVVDIQPDGKLRFVHQPTGGASGSRAIATPGVMSNNTWFHFAAVYNSKGTMSLYVNGALQASSAAAAPTYIPETVRSFIGQSSLTGGRNVEGQLDEIRFWARALEPTDIAANYTKSFNNPTTLAAPTSCLASYYKFNATTGSTATDFSGNGYTGNLVQMNNADWVTSGAGVTSQAAPTCQSLGTSTNYALDFDGSNDFVSFTNPLTFLQNSTFTVEGWFSSASSAYQILFEAFPATGGGQYISVELLTDGRMQVVYRPNGGSSGGTVLRSTNALNTGTWKHFAVAYNLNNTLSLYIDGVHQQTESTSGRISAASLQAALGRRSNGTTYFAGRLDEIRLWSRTLAPADVLDLYNETFTDPTSAANCLEVYYTFEESFGTTVGDKTGNGNGATLMNMDNADWVVSGAGVTEGLAPACGDLGGDVNYALDFDGIDDYVALPVSTAFDNSTFAVEGWFRADPSLVNGVVFDFYELSAPDATIPTGNYLTAQVESDGRLRLTYRSPAASAGGADLYSTTLVKTGNWTHVAAVLNLDHTVSLYINGYVEATSGPVNLIDDGSVYARVGALGNNTRWFKGQIDELRVWSRSLAAADVLGLYNDAFTNPTSAGACLDVYYQFEESIGNTAEDASGNGNDGALINMQDNDYVLSGATVTPVAAPNCADLSGDVDYALDFDGVNDYVDLPILNFLANTGFSVEGWFQAANTSTTGVLFEAFPVGDASGLNFITIEVANGGTLQAKYRSPANNAGGVGVFTPGSVADGNWHHYTAVMSDDFKTWTLYLDGVEVASTGGIFNPIPGDVDAAIGRLHSGGSGGNPGSRYFSGRIDETRIWTGELTAAGVAEVYNESFTNPGDAASCIGAYYQFEESIGTTATDASGNGNTGTLVGMQNNDYVLSTAPFTPQPAAACAVVLPVELLYFSAASINGAVELEWQTASEQGNQGFEILHSTNGTGWEAIGFVAGQGSTATAHHYGFTHQQPAAGTNFYRLKQIDFDGTFAYSNIVVVSAAGTTNPMQIAPNPVRGGELSITVAMAGDASAEVQLFSAWGQRVWTKRLIQPTITVATADLPKGVYMAVAVVNGTRYTQKVVIQ